MGIAGRGIRQTDTPDRAIAAAAAARGRARPNRYLVVTVRDSGAGISRGDDKMKNRTGSILRSMVRWQSDTRQVGIEVSKLERECIWRSGTWPVIQTDWYRAIDANPNILF